MDGSDRTLVRRALGGDQDSYRALVERYAGAVRSIVRRMDARTGTHDDLVQEVFMQAFAMLPRLERPERFSSWLYQIARNRSLRQIDRDGRAPGFVDLANLDPDLTAHEDLITNESPVMQTLASLPEEHRIALSLRHLEGMSLACMAEVLGLSVNGVNARLYRARKMLRSRLQRTSR